MHPVAHLVVKICEEGLEQQYNNPKNQTTVYRQGFQWRKWELEGKIKQSDGNGENLYDRDLDYERHEDGSARGGSEFLFSEKLSANITSIH